MTTASVPPEIFRAAEALLGQAGKGPLVTIRLIAGGRNNRVFQVATTEEIGILKQYFTSPTARHDRFTSEIAWYRFCYGQSVGQLPVLWGVDPETRFALFAAIPGRKLLAGEVTAEHVAQAAEFFTCVNDHRQAPAAAQLPLAADACFHLEDYLAVVERRLSRLLQVPSDDGPSRVLHDWLNGTLGPVLSDVRCRIEAAYSPAARTAELPPKQRCLSPSDFGFHNALLDDAGKLWFLDFEYAGWDDPAKTVCDFFWQVDVPAPRETMPIFLDAIHSFGDDAVERARILFPLFGIQWVTIVLNEFLPENQARRHFASGQDVTIDHRIRQWEIARRLVADVQHSLDSIHD